MVPSSSNIEQMGGGRQKGKWYADDGQLHPNTRCMGQQRRWKFGRTAVHDLESDIPGDPLCGWQVMESSDQTVSHAEKQEGMIVASSLHHCIPLAVRISVAHLFFLVRRMDLCDSHSNQMLL